MTKPLVSVVIPIYNMEEFLVETLESVLTSNYPHFEVILMDDGSKDGSYALARQYAQKDARVRTYTQSNAGACTARNHAISLAQGEYIFPLDADDKVGAGFFKQAVDVFEADKDIKVVYSRAEFFGDRSGEWKLRPFSLELLARKNMIPVSAMFRKSDWARTGGYCNVIIAREDWEFWIAMLKDGGKVVRLDQVELYYRVRSGSKRIADRPLKKHVIDVLNKRHPEFFEKELGGPLRYQRSWSRLINKISLIFHPRRMIMGNDFQDLSSFMRTLPIHFENEGILIYEGRNRLKEFDVHDYKLIVKSYRIPHLINRIAYNFFRASKARRSYGYALMLRKAGIHTPAPVGFYSTGTWLLFGHSYFVSLKSECPFTYRNLAEDNFQGDKERVLRAIARTTAALHEKGFLHKDYSGGNILFRETVEDVIVEIVDLNRMRFGKVGLETGCKNFERLTGTREMFAVLADEYAKARGFDAEKCLELIEKSHCS
ncbi:MAG: glycosyltransferase [Prevotella sp.]|jgi:glycosyltransferase involved in cell wall biosynthesis|nr:glycosyltransferase [Prevotella sp.]